MDRSSPILITELMKQTEQYLLSQGYKPGTMGTYKATWNKFAVFSETEYYSREIAESFLKKYFGVDIHSAEQKLDMRMRHALRHLNALEDFRTSRSVPRKMMRSHVVCGAEKYRRFFGAYLTYCKQQQYSSSWFSNTESALRIFLTALNDTDVEHISEINARAIDRFVNLVIDRKEFCQNTRRSRIRTVSVYLTWIFQHGFISLDYSYLLPELKKSPKMLPDVWSEDDIQKILNVIDNASPTGKRNYAIFLLLARTGLRISDVVLLRFENIDWRKNCINIVQKKTGKPLSVPLNAEIGEAIISYLKYGRPESDSDAVFLGHNAPFHPLAVHNNFNSEMRKYMRLAGVDYKAKRHSGVHTIRASFATNMLKHGASLESISQVLGHSDINVATSYLRVDIDHLRICALGLEVTR